jgi:hypothetical protein
VRNIVADKHPGHVPGARHRPPKTSSDSLRTSIPSDLIPCPTVSPPHRPLIKYGPPSTRAVKFCPTMDSTKYIGMDVHKESISIAVMNAAGKIGMECVIETKASTILEFVDGLRGNVQVTFEEGTSAAWFVRPVETAGYEIGGLRSAKKPLKIGSNVAHVAAKRLSVQVGGLIISSYPGEHNAK